MSTLFDFIHGVQRHVKNWCQEKRQNNKRKSESEIEPDSKWVRVQDSDKEDDNEEGFINLWETAKSEGEYKYNQLYDQYTANGETDHNAQEMADERMSTHNRRKFVELYSSLLTFIFFPIKNKGLHRPIVFNIDKQRRTDTSLTTAEKISCVNIDMNCKSYVTDLLMIKTVMTATTMRAIKNK